MQVLTDLREIVQPAHTALVLVDVQRDFCMDDGAFGTIGVDLAMYPAAIDRMAELLAAARDAAVMPIFIQMTSLPGGASDSPAQIRFNLRLHKDTHSEPLRYAVDGSPGQQFVPALTPGPGEVVVKKYRSSGFWGTNLDLVLRSNGIRAVVMAGCTTEGCVESTARDAMFNDYYVVIATDAVASDDPRQHDASLFLMSHRFDLASNAELKQAWAAPGQVSLSTDNSQELPAHG